MSKHPELPLPHPLPDVPGYNYGGGGGGGGGARKRKKEKKGEKKERRKKGWKKKEEDRQEPSRRRCRWRVYLEMLLSCGGTATPALLRCPTIWPSYTNRRATGCSSPASQHPTPAPPPPALPPTPWQNKAASLSLSSQSRDVPARPVHSLEHEVVPELIKRAQAAAYHRSIPATRSSPVLSFLDQSRPLPARPRQQGDRV